jgi:hypothetical protein
MTLTARICVPVQTPALWITASMCPGLVHLAGDAASLLDAGQVPDDCGGTAGRQIARLGEPGPAARVDHHLVTLAEQIHGSCPSEAVGQAGDEDASHAFRCYGGGQRLRRGPDRWPSAGLPRLPGRVPSESGPGA